MIGWVDDWLRGWAMEVRGGLPGRTTFDLSNVIEFESERTSGSMSHDAWLMECVVRRLSTELQGIIKIHYLPQHGVTRDRVQAAARFLGDKPPRIRAPRGSAAYREQQAPTLARQQSRYYRLLALAHEVIAEQLRAHH